MKVIGIGIVNLKRMMTDGGSFALVGDEDSSGRKGRESSAGV